MAHPSDNDSRAHQCPEVSSDLPNGQSDVDSNLDTAESESMGSLTQQSTIALKTQPVASSLHPFYSLPAELILDIVDLLPPEAFINFAFANYPLLHAYGLAPALSRPRVNYITTKTTIPALFPLLRIPAEIMLQIMRNLKPMDTMRFVVANYEVLSKQRIAPPLTEIMVRQLRNAVSASILSASANARPCRCPGLCRCEHLLNSNRNASDGKSRVLQQPEGD